MLRTVTLALALFAPAVAGRRPDSSELGTYTFENYVKDFRKSYASAADREAHRKVFDNNLRTIISQNKVGGSWTAGVNEFTDMSREEMLSMKGINKAMLHNRRAKVETKPMESLPRGLPDSIDWRTEGVVTSVKNQGFCGSCWTFSATEALESHVAIATGHLFTLSEQQFVSCVENPDECGGTGGCDGATMELAFEYAKEHGMSTEWTYPYGSYFGNVSSCMTNGESATGPSAVAGITGYVTNPTNSYTDLMTSVATAGPISITVDASTWHLYEGGIYDGCDQDSPDLDHGVLLVGYGSENGTDYWLVRNSWGPTWGEEGYIRILRTSDEADNCGVDTNPSDGVGCAGGPSNVTVCGTCGILYDTTYPTGAFVN